MQRLSLLFLLKKTKMLSNGTVPIYARITISETRMELATKRQIDPLKWNSVAQKAIGVSEEIKSLNSYLKTLEQQIYTAHQELIQQGSVVTVENLKTRLTGKKEITKLLIPIFKEHNERIKALVGQEYSPGTLQRYETSLKHIITFINWKYKISDIDIKNIDHEFISSYDFYLRSIRKCANNSAVKIYKELQKNNPDLYSKWMANKGSIPKL